MAQRLVAHPSAAAVVRGLDDVDVFEQALRDTPGVDRLLRVAGQQDRHVPHADSHNHAGFVLIGRVQVCGRPHDQHLGVPDPDDIPSRKRRCGIEVRLAWREFHRGADVHPILRENPGQRPQTAVVVVVTVSQDDGLKPSHASACKRASQDARVRPGVDQHGVTRVGHEHRITLTDVEKHDPGPRWRGGRENAEHQQQACDEHSPSSAATPRSRPDSPGDEHRRHHHHDERWATQNGQRGAGP
jgi:hypothetical protein